MQVQQNSRSFPAPDPLRQILVARPLPDGVTLPHNTPLQAQFVIGLLWEDVGDVLWQGAELEISVTALAKLHHLDFQSVNRAVNFMGKHGFEIDRSVRGKASLRYRTITGADQQEPQAAEEQGDNIPAEATRRLRRLPRKPVEADV